MAIVSPPSSGSPSRLLSPRSDPSTLDVQAAEESNGRLSQFMKRRRGQSVGRALEEPSRQLDHHGLSDASNRLEHQQSGHRRRNSRDAVMSAILPKPKNVSPPDSRFISPTRPTKGSRFALRRASSKVFDDGNGGETNGEWESSTVRADSPVLATSHSPAKRPQALPIRAIGEHVAGSGQGPGGETFLPRRISGWFNSVLSTSPPPAVPPLPLPATTTPPASPSKRAASATAEATTTRQPPRALAGLDRMLDKARIYFMDTDSNVDRCPDDIWLIGGVVHEGWRPPGELLTSAPGETAPRSRKKQRKQSSKRDAEGKGRGKLRTALANRRGKGQGSGDALSPLTVDAASLASTSETSLRTSVSPPESTISSSASPPSPSRLSASSSYETSSTLSRNPLTTAQTQGWPPLFYLDFASRIQLTYRSQFPAIPCAPPATMAHTFHSVMGSLTASLGRGVGNLAGEGLSSDAGWGCMLRTGQSLLANALANIHLGRDWRRNLPMPDGPDAPLPPLFATYVRLLSWFMDDPSPLAPFSVHRFALMGKQLGKQVGEWFGPSTAAGAIKALTNDFAPAGLGVATAVDGTLYKTDVYAAAGTGWSRPVLILLNLRLGIEGVNPIYYSALRSLFSLPQSVGIAGGRPSSSYYFVGAQGDSLFYIDPHHTTVAVPHRPPPPDLRDAALHAPMRSLVSEDWETIDFTPTTDEEALERFYSSCYREEELRSFHCERPRKMPLSGLDPSMLVGLLVQTEADFLDLVERLKPAKGSASLVHIADRPPAWVRTASTSGASTSRKTSASTARPADATADSDDEAGDEDASFNEPEDWDITTDEDLEDEAEEEAPERMENFAPPRSSPSPVLVDAPAPLPRKAEEDWEGVDEAQPDTPRTLRAG